MEVPPVTRRVPFFSNAATFDRVRSSIEARIRRSFDAGCAVDGPVVREFEAAVASRIGAKHAIAVGSGTDALLMLLEATGVGEGDEVVTTVYSFIASASTIAHTGARPVFVDIDPVTYNINPSKIDEAITHRTKAILPVHLFTQPAEMSTIVAIAARHHVALLEDSAESMGMSQDGVHCGLFGLGGVLSFYPTKTLGAAGDAGMIITNNDELAEVIGRLRGTTAAVDAVRPDGHAPHFSFMDEIQAAVLASGMEVLDLLIAQRRVLAERYSAQLEALYPRVVPPRFPTKEAEQQAVYYVYLIEADRRDELASFLNVAGIETEIYYPIPMHRQPALAYLGYREGDFPAAERASRRALALPLYPDMRENDVDAVGELIRCFYNCS